MPGVRLEYTQTTFENASNASLLRIIPGVGHEMPAATQDAFIAGILSAVARSKVGA